ncbi:chitin synthase regulatory factor chr2 [Gigaspora margarita]|uniref:Chitin synthase regulatory factor chr2 n=1 Tax=Gigaspora margarita TaxID=4874 RepID=A0A8H4EVW0_GIGMA|nr:chitin synthase regulatory factor chr2 [Gigaspora margarita]
MISVNSLNINRGLIIDEQEIQLSNSISYDLKPHHKIEFIENTSFYAKLVKSTIKNESFLLNNQIELSADEIEHVSQIFDKDDTINSVRVILTDKSPTKDIFLTILCTKVELIIKKETIKPSDELIYKVKEALKHCDPYQKLMDVFNSYGYFLPKKIILGHKIYRIINLIADKHSTEPNDKSHDAKWSNLDDFSESKFEDILNQWEEYMSAHNFDLSYFVSINGEFIKKNELENWIKSCLEYDLDSLQVIKCKELYPLYEIFDLPLLQEVVSVLGISGQIESTLGIDNQAEFINRNDIKEKVLMEGIVPIKDPPYSYSVKFPFYFKSNNYQIFGKLITQDDKPIDEVIIKFEFMDIYGFLIFMENYKHRYKNPKIAWILIGIPAEVGYFSPNTRKINVLGSGNEPFALKLNNNIILQVPKNLPHDSVIVFSFKHPLSNYEPNFIAKIQSYQANKILLNVQCLDFEPSDSDSLFSLNSSLAKDSDSSLSSQELASTSNEKDTVIREGVSSNYVEANVKKPTNKDHKSEEYSKRGYIKDNDFVTHEEDSDSDDINIDNFEYEKPNYDKEVSKMNIVNASEYSIRWFILQNSDTIDSTETIYLNTIGQNFHLKTKSKEKLSHLIKPDLKNQVNNQIEASTQFSTMSHDFTEEKSPYSLPDLNNQVNNQIEASNQFSIIMSHDFTKEKSPHSFKPTSINQSNKASTLFSTVNHDDTTEEQSPYSIKSTSEKQFNNQPVIPYQSPTKNYDDSTEGSSSYSIKPTLENQINKLEVSNQSSTSHEEILNEFKTLFDKRFKNENYKHMQMCKIIGDESDLTRVTVNNFYNRQTKPHKSTLEKIRIWVNAEKKK